MAPRGSLLAVRVPLVLVAGAFLCTTAAAHGFVSDPRQRGALRCERNIKPQVLDPAAPIDYCPECQFSGGVNMVRGGYGTRWSPYEPLVRPGGRLGLCGDPVGDNSHMRSGRFANPPSMSYVKRYAPGSVANFEFDVTANHGGYLEFYLCDVSQMDNNDIAWNGFSDHCHYLKRVPHESCESGNDIDCGPVDPKFPGRWVLPPGGAGGDNGDHILGGASGKMGYQIPNVEIQDGVVQMYWLTANSCMEPSGFMANYSYPQAWNNIYGDGGVVGGRPIHDRTCDMEGEWAEEYTNCADVLVTGESQGDGKGWYFGIGYEGRGSDGKGSTDWSSTIYTGQNIANGDYREGRTIGGDVNSNLATGDHDGGNGGYQSANNGGNGNYRYSANAGNGQEDYDGDHQGSSGGLAFKPHR